MVIDMSNEVHTQKDIQSLHYQILATRQGIRIPCHLPPLSSYWYRNILSAREQNHWWSHYRANGHLAAHLGRSQRWEPFYGRSIDFHFCHYDQSDQAAFAWLYQTIIDDLPKIDDGAMLTLPLAYQKLWPAWRKIGFSIESLSFGGFPRIALDSLLAKQSQPWPDLAALNLTLTPIHDANHIHEIAALRADVFRRQPEYCWFYHNPGVAEQFDSMTRARLTAGRQWRLDRNNHILGFFGYGAQTTELFGKSVSLDFAFAPEIQGLGLGRLAYKVMLKAMIDDGIAYFNGTTANPAVLHMSRHLLRPIITFNLRQAEHCPPLERFCPYLPDDFPL
jgi:hypothetical protein